MPRHWLLLVPFAPLLLLGAAPAQQAAPTAAPLTYFQESCARCHGDYGAFYSQPVGGTRTAAQLEQTIREMAEGPGAAPLAPEGLTRQTELHLALREELPYAVITSLEGGLVRGEALPGTSLALEEGGAGKAIPLTGHSFTFQLRGEAGTTATLVAERAGKKILLPLGAR